MSTRTLKEALTVWTLAFASAASLWAAPAPAHPVVTAVPRVTPQGENSYTFPDTPVGQTSTTCFSVCFTEGSECDGSGGTAYDVESPSPPFFLTNTVYLNLLGDACDAATGIPVSFPAVVPPGEVISFDASFSPTAPVTSQGQMAVGSLSGPAIFDLSGTGTGSGTGCANDATTLCINNRFAITTHFSTVEGGGLSGNGQAIPFSSLGLADGGSFWFFSATNPEVLVKVIDGCASNGAYWVFFAATTNVGFSLTVTDSATGLQKTYTNPDLTAALPVQDTSAFTSCP